MLNDEQKTTISNKVEEEYTCTDNISGVVSIEHKTDKVYDGYITANTLNNENNYDTTYNETLRVMVSNKDIAQKIEVRENSEISLYEETNIDKNQVLDMLGDKGSIDVLDENGNMVIGDEMLTPDSSRFWPADGYEAGHGQPSFDKQFARDWLKANPDNDWTLPQEIVDKTIEKYLQAYKMLTGKDLDK